MLNSPQFAMSLADEMALPVKCFKQITESDIRKPYGFMQSSSVLLPSQINMTKLTPHLGYFFQFNQCYGEN